MAELKCKKCGDILNDDNCDELYHLHINNIDVDNSTELMCNDCAFREDARKHVQEFICDDESLKLDERMFISFKRVMEKYKIEEKWRDYLNEVFSSGEDPLDYICHHEGFESVEDFIYNCDKAGDADDKLDYLADYYYGDNWELGAQFQDWYYTYFGSYWVTGFEDDYV